MSRKIILLLAMLSLTACSNVNEFIEELKGQSESVVELEGSKNNEDFFHKNPEISSTIYKEHFFEKELLDAGEMKSDIVDGKTIFEGKNVPVRIEKFPEPYYVNYLFNPSEEMLDLALILTEGTFADGEELPEDVFIYIEYDNENNEIFTLLQENANGDDVGYIGLFEEEWQDLAKKYIQFVHSVN